jgi:VCBS repeat-containing protein
VTVTINGANDAPVAASVSGSTGEDAIYAGAVSATDVDSEAITFSLVGTAPAGVTFSADGTFSVAPSPEDQGLDDGESRTVTFDYVANDGTASSASRTATVTINGANDAPVAAAFAGSTGEDAIFSGAVSATDVDGEALTYALVGTAPAGVTFNADGNFTTAPSVADQGLDDGESRVVTFDYLASDGTANSATRTATITINGANDAPVALAFVGSTGEGAAFLGAVSASDVDGEALTFALVGTAPAGVTFGANGTFEVAPLASDQGLDSGESRVVTFDYLASDGTANSAPQTVMVTVNGANDAPVLAQALGDQQVQEGAALQLTLPAASFTDPDGEALTYSLAVANGGALPSWLTFNAETLSFSGTPAAGDVGTLEITVTASDGEASVSDLFLLEVVGANRNPDAQNDTGALSEDGDEWRFFGKALANDTDADGDTLTITIGIGSRSSSYGTLTLEDDGDWLYVLANDSAAVQALGAGQTYVDSFEYSISDGNGGTDVASIAITITGMNESSGGGGGGFL